MVKTKGIERTVKKYVDRAGVAGPEYEAGIKAPKNDWEGSTLAAAGTFKMAITAPSVPQLFSAGVKKAGNAKWQKMALDKGVARFGDGVAKSQKFFRNSMSDVLATIEGISLSARGPRGSDQNYIRSKEIGTKLHAKRLAARAVGGV